MTKDWDHPRPVASYFDELCHAMWMIADHSPRAVFMGQAVACEGTAMSKTFAFVPKERLVEMPVAEDMQMGMAIGAALAGDLPICCYPRINFLLLAVNQLVLHLDKLPLYSRGGFKPKVIIRTSIASPEPLNPGEQHLGNFTEAFREMLKTVEVTELWTPELIVPAYSSALKREGSTLLIEHMGKY